MCRNAKRQWGWTDAELTLFDLERYVTERINFGARVAEGNISGFTKSRKAKTPQSSGNRGGGERTTYRNSIAIPDTSD